MLKNLHIFFFKWNVLQSKHNNIFNNVKLSHVSVTSNHHQQTFKYMDMACSVLRVWYPILFTFYRIFTWFLLALTVKILSVHCVFLRQEKNFSGLHRNSARQELRFKMLLCIMIIFIMNVLLYSFHVSRNVNVLTFFETTLRSVQKPLNWSAKVDEWKTKLMSLVILFHLLCAQHVSDINPYPTNVENRVSS